VAGAVVDGFPRTTLQVTATTYLDNTSILTIVGCEGSRGAPLCR